jgi:hypothetical protein
MHWCRIWAEKISSNLTQCLSDVLSTMGRDYVALV